MPVDTINGVQLFWELAGRSGDPIVLVHGSWIDHHDWDRVVPLLARRFRVLSYDRRGHSRSERPASRYSIHHDVADLAALIETLRLAPAHIVGNSSGGAIVLRLAGERPHLFRSLIVNEPTVLDLLARDPAARDMFVEAKSRMDAVAERLAAGDMAGGARDFIENVAFGPGAWAALPAAVRDGVTANAPTFLAEMRDPEFFSIDLQRLRAFAHPALLTLGEHGPPIFPPVVERIAGVLPGAQRHVFANAGHEPEQSHPDVFAATVADFIARRAV
jgi:pimeloyl-ACP methyl ester carboxylesterase